MNKLVELSFEQYSWFPYHQYSIDATISIVASDTRLEKKTLTNLKVGMLFLLILPFSSPICWLSEGHHHATGQKKNTRTLSTKSSDENQNLQEQHHCIDWQEKKNKWKRMTRNKWINCRITNNAQTPTRYNAMQKVNCDMSMQQCLSHGEDQEEKTEKTRNPITKPADHSMVEWTQKDR